MSEQATGGNTTSDVATGGVLFKLVIFSLSLGIIPISSYFASIKYVWNGNSTYAAITAVASANIVLVAYIVTSVLEDRTPSSGVAPTASRETRKQK